jgi:hypothetical protein
MFLSPFLFPQIFPFIPSFLSWPPYLVNRMACLCDRKHSISHLHCPVHLSHWCTSFRSRTESCSLVSAKGSQWWLGHITVSPLYLRVMCTWILNVQKYSETILLLCQTRTKFFSCCSLSDTAWRLFTLHSQCNQHYKSFCVQEDDQRLYANM